MKPTKILIAVTAIFTMLYNSTTAQTNKNLDVAKKAIAASNNIYFQSFAKKDSSVFINRYSEDCLIMLPDSPPMQGHSGAQKFFRFAYDQIGLRNGKFITTQVYGAGDDFVVEEGLWQSFDAKNVMFDNGKFLVLWKRTPKGWKMFRDSFSSNREKK